MDAAGKTETGAVIDLTRVAHCHFVSPDQADLKAMTHGVEEGAKRAPGDGVKNMLAKFTTMVNYLSDNVLLQSKRLAAFMLAVMLDTPIESLQPMLNRQVLDLAGVFVLDNKGEPWVFKELHAVEQAVFDSYAAANTKGHAAVTKLA